MTGMEALFNAVIEQAAKDYRKTAEKLKKQPNDVALRYELYLLAKFFPSERFSRMTDADGELILELLRKETGV